MIKHFHFVRALSASLLVVSLLVMPAAPAFAQLAGSVDTSGTTVPVIAPSTPATPPLETTPLVITTPIPAPTPTPAEPTTAAVTMPSNPVTPIITPPADTTPPAIADVSSISLEPHNATIIWTTDELATSQLEYGTTPSYGSIVTIAASASLAHDATMLNLTPHTTYYYCIRATDLAGNTSSSCGHSVTTAAQAVMIDTLPPTVSLETVSAITTSSASVMWATDELAQGYVEYGTTNAYGFETPLETDFTLSHTAAVSGLSANTTYHYRIHSRDSSGNVMVTPDNTFMTNPPAGTISSVPTTTATVPQTTTSVATPAATGSTTTVTTPNLVLSSVAANSISETGATITWITDLPSDSRVEYGNAHAFNQTAQNTTLTTSHSVTLTGLDTDTTYEFRVVSASAGVGAAQTVSDTHTFTTLARPIVIDPPANILSSSSSNVTATGASVSFTTDETTHGMVEYGLTTSYGESAADASVQTSHTLGLSSLIPNTTYHFRVKAVDAADNITYSIDHTFVTPGVLVTVTNTSTSTQATSTPSASTPTSEIGPMVETTVRGSASTGVAAPALVTIAPADTEVVFDINPQATVGDTTVIVVRGDGTYPTSPSDGHVVYSGDAATFTDTNLTNGSTYDYSVYTRSAGGGYSSPVHIAAQPTLGIEQVQLDRNPVLEPAIAGQHFTTDISLGAKDSEVEHLQQILNTENVHLTGLTTGYFGPLTLTSLKRFQAKYSLPQTGVVDAATRSVLNSLSQGWMLLSAPTGLSDLTADIKPGDTGQNVADLQLFLAYEGSYEEGYITATYGPLTKKSVADFQKKFGVTPVSGYVGPKTRHTIQTLLGQRTSSSSQS